MKKSILIISTFLLVAFIAGNGLAWDSGKNRGKGYGNQQNCQGFQGKGAWNDLSQEQKDELAALRQSFIDDTYDLRSAKFQKHQELRMLMETSDPDRTKLDTLSRELTEIQGQLRNKRIDFQLAAKKISPELGMGMGFGQNRGHGFKRGCQKGAQERGANCPRYNN